MIRGFTLRPLLGTGVSNKPHRGSGKTACRVLAAVLSWVFVFANPSAATAGDPWIDRVVGYWPGNFAGFGADELPDIVLGPPEGGGQLEGSVDVVSLGDGGSIEIVFRNNLVVDGPGDDLVVFENPFYAGSLDGLIFNEFAFVEVSADGRTFERFPVDADSGGGLAGQQPVLSNSANMLDPLDPGSGGDRFDIGDLGLSFVRFVRLIDVGGEIPDFGDITLPGTKGGFDLDAVGAIHSMKPAKIRGLVLASGEAVAGARVLVQAEPGSKRRRRRTRIDGSFRLRRLLPIGNYTIRVTAEGLGSDQLSVNLIPGNLKARVVLDLH